MSTKLSPVKATPYMSVVEGRSPRQKVHTHLSHAKNAFDTPKYNKLVGEKGQYTHGWGAIFEHTNGDWVQIFEIPQPEEKDRTSNPRRSEKYETRPWRTNDHGQPLPAVRPATHSQAEPEPVAHSDLGGVHGNADERGLAGDDQRTSRSEHASEVHLTLAEVVAYRDEAQQVLAKHEARWEEKHFDYDLHGMIRMNAKIDGLNWVIGRMSNGSE